MFWKVSFAINSKNQMKPVKILSGCATKLLNIKACQRTFPYQRPIPGVSLTVGLVRFLI